MHLIKESKNYLSLLSWESKIDMQEGFFKYQKKNTLQV